MVRSVRAAVAFVLVVTAGALEEFTVYMEPVSLRPGEVHNHVMKPVPLPDWVVNKYADKQMGVVSFQLDIVRVSEDGAEARVPLYEVYNHHTIQLMGQTKDVTYLYNEWNKKDPFNPGRGGVPTPHCGTDVESTLRAIKKRLGDTSRSPRMYVGPTGGAEYRDSERDLPAPYRQIVDSPQAFLAILHFINAKVHSDTPVFECPCTSDRTINLTNGTIDGLKPIPFDCSRDLLLQNNPSCKLKWYKGGYRCCENGNFLIENPDFHAANDTVLAKFTLKIDDVTPKTCDVHHSLTFPDASGNNVEYDVPQCQPPRSELCVHEATHVSILNTSGAWPWQTVELLTARGHQHVGGLGMELYDDTTGQLICASQPRVGTSSEAGNELGFVVGIPPCVWGPPPLSPPPRIQPGGLLRTVSRYNSTVGHLGVMGLWFIQWHALPIDVGSDIVV